MPTIFWRKLFVVKPCIVYLFVFIFGSIDYVTLNPDPPIKGQNLEIDFKGYLSETVPNGTVVELLVKYGVVKLLQKKFDFCDEIQKVDEICPIPEGDLTFHKQVELPKDIRKLLF